MDEQFARRITEYRRIIAFRNILIHSYVDVDDALVWDVVKTKLPLLQEEVEAIMVDAASPEEGTP